jgi:hypothetical protein
MELSPDGIIAPVGPGFVDAVVDGIDDAPLASCLADEEDGLEEDAADDLDERLLRRHPPPTGTVRRAPPRVQ